ncbi:general transcription factor 3C polypeptide 1 [Phymastichus coffea]|uniref:general transcription factor 3C polypeptide 1 n=1 Tax=Phymastichus coffea TaxID=108790 RepID=UPI00273CA549|nr:general transcription factor 3C polypeptide 1 [Phymastichus coffea]
MNMTKSIGLVEILIDEIALEGLDGITLEALWQRLAMRLGDTLPLKNAFMQQIWIICLELHDFKFFELENARETLVIFDRYELEYMSSEVEKGYDQRDIYPHCPVEDVKLGIKGSCSTYHSRKDVSTIVKDLTLCEVIEKYGQKLVIVASQDLRENALIDSTVSPIIQLSLPHYCLLERIGRTRKMGEISIKKSAHIKEDAKTLFYMRKVLLEQGLIRKQVYYQGTTGAAYNGQNIGTLIHLTRFYNVRKPKVIMWAEHLINFLKSKENYAAEYNEVKTELNLDYSIKKFFKIQMLQKVFRTDLKVPYRSYYPNHSDKEWHVKANASKERIIKLVTLTDPNTEITDIWRTEESKEDCDFCQLDIRNHKLYTPFLKQIYAAVESKESKGASQSELATEMGFPKLIGRAILRNLDKSKIVSSYVDDVGRQRTKKFVSKKFESQNFRKKQLENEIIKIKKNIDSVVGEKRKPSITRGKESEVTKVVIQHGLESNENILLANIDSKNENAINKNNQDLLSRANSILRKYKITKTRNKYKYTSLTNIKKTLGINYKCNEKLPLNENNSTNTIKSQQTEGIHESDFYKMIETNVIIQKPECKKKSSKVAVVGFMKDVQDSDNLQSTVSYRLIRRANLILDSVKEHKIIEDTQKLMKYINKEEDKEGLDVRMDKNSLIRLLQKLSEDNLIKYIKLVLRNKNHTKEKVVNFICDPSVNEDDTVIQSAIEQAKLKFCMMETNILNLIDGEKKVSTVDNTESSTRKSEEGKYIIYRNDSLGKKYGYCPKFVRLKAMHIFLYYLIYDHTEKPESKSDFFEHLRQQGYSSDDLPDKNVDVYSKEINWKMLIPPLPKHRGYPKGWALIRDILLRMPLSIFVKVHNVNFEVLGLQEYLNHPVKKHFLMRDIPSAIRNLLFLRRKYMFSVHELVTRLCFLGLVQFGPQMLKEKDQVFIYLNRKTELLDTTSSAAGYHKIEDKPYPVIKFCFSTMAEVERYWYEMWNTCINTDLGGRNVVEGKDILLEDLPRKPEMIEATRVKTVAEAIVDDIGFVPGDRKGAAGIDSAFFSHLKRNWNWINAVQQSKPKKPNWPTQTVNLTKASIRYRASHPRKVLQTKKRSSPVKHGQGKTGTDSSKFVEKTKTKRHVPLNLSFVQSSKPSKVIRKVLPRKRALRNRVKYDEIDFSALQRMDKLRVDWEQHEDNILLVCKVAMVYLCPNPRRNPVTFTAIRDVLRSYSFTSYNKTSRACQRRLLYMLKQPKTVNSVLLGVEEIKQDYHVNKRFGGLNEKLRSESESVMEYEKKIEKVFKDLVTYIAKKYYNISDMEHREPIILPKTIQEFNVFHKLKLPTKTISSPGVSKEVRDITDIHTATINSVIHSSMCCGKERRSWAYQLFRVYQQYPEYLLRSAMLKIRADQMVTMKKSYMSAYKKFGNCMPMSSSQYQLSSAYYYKFRTKWPYEVFSESYEMLMQLLENYIERQSKDINGVEVKPGLGGMVAAVYDFLGANNIDIDTEIPDQIIMLDPGLPEKDEVYQRIAVRYQSILNGLNSESVDDVKSTVNENNELNEARQTDMVDEQQNFVAVRSTKRMAEEYHQNLKAKRLKVSNDEDNLRREKDQAEVEMKIRTEEINIVQNEAPKTSSPEENALTSEPMVINCCNDEQKLESLLFESQSWTHHILDLQSCADKDLETNLGIPTVQNNSTNSLSINHMQSFLDYISNKEDLSCSESKGTYIKVNELVKNVANWEAMEDLESRIEVQDVRTRQTRIAMLRMREELHDLTFHDSHHAHEYFVVNSFKLFSSLKVTEGLENPTTTYKGMNLPKALLPINIEIADKILEDIKKFAVFPKNPIPYQNFETEMKANEKFDWNEVNNICKFIKSKEEFGASLHELVTNFNYLKNTLADILVFLSEKRIVLRAGIIAVRYIYQKFTNPWIIHSYKILRLEKESHQSLPRGSVYVLDNDESTLGKEKENNRVTTAANLFYNTPKSHANEISTKASNIFVESSKKPSETNVTENTNNNKIMEASTTISNSDVIKMNNSEEIKNDNVNDVNGNAASLKRLRRNRTVLLKPKDIYRAAKLLDFNTAEEIKVVIKPWIRIDGVLNRRVLDRMLGAVLCYCFEKPGTSLTNVQNRFTPAIQPYHTRELIEILTRLGCVIMSVQKMSKVTLFSRPAKLDMTGNPDLTADSDSVFIKPTILSTLKFGMFLSNRSYNLDFLSTL